MRRGASFQCAFHTSAAWWTCWGWLGGSSTTDTTVLVGKFPRTGADPRFAENYPQNDLTIAKWVRHVNPPNALRLRSAAIFQRWISPRMAPPPAAAQLCSFRLLPLMRGWPAAPPFTPATGRNHSHSDSDTAQWPTSRATRPSPRRRRLGQEACPGGAWRRRRTAPAARAAGSRQAPRI
jgi:hypothetical protein